MLNKLTSKYQKEIALSFISIFIISGLLPIKAYCDVFKNYPAGIRNVSLSRSFYYSKNDNSEYLNYSIDKSDENAWFFGEKKVNTLKHHYVKESAQGPQIGGPSQPEMTSFKSVGTDNMVNLFTGDFSYNIPLLDVGGYPVNLFYNSGITMDQEASWVGLGWNINPGTISRAMRGIPDDFNGEDKITKTQSMRADETWGVTTGGDIELVGVPLTIAANLGISFNNRLGVSTDAGITPSFSISEHAGDEKSASLNFSIGLNLSSRSGANVTPAVSYKSNEDELVHGTASNSISYNSRQGLTDLHVSAEHKSYQGWSMGGIDGTLSFAYPSVTPTISMPLTHLSFNGKFNIGLEMFSVHPHLNIGGFYNKTYIAPTDQTKIMPSYGMMYMHEGNGNKDALLDFNRIQDGVYTPTSPTIGMPAYTYDVFNISGEGIGGNFRAYRSDLGYVHDPYTETREDVGTVGVEMGVGNGFHAGGNLQYVYTPVTAGEWESNNIARESFAFKKTGHAITYQPVYFKNPGEKAIPDIAFQNAIGGADLVRLQLTRGGTGSATLGPTLEKVSTINNNVLGIIPVPDVQKARDKRTQVITTLTAAEASRVALDTSIYSYDPNSSQIIFGRCNNTPGVSAIEREGGYRKSHHISEINVLEQNGKKYVYGIPVYNIKQVDVTMAVNNGSNETQQSTFTPQDDSQDNHNGKDWYYEKQEMPAYTHSFLLSSIVSPNYIDVKGDGITDDDMGDAVRFNYSKSDNLFKWRTPANNATYSEGLKTYDKDDKGHYIYGEREQWYLYSIESKNLIARFYVSEDRSDGRSVTNNHGGLDATGNQKLTKIALYSKADLVRQANTGKVAKPIKTVYFEYSNKLCQDLSGLSNNIENAAHQKGKLTLESIYFTYNGNEKQKKNKYTFHYPEINNPNYDYVSNDRWGNYKPKKDAVGNENNPGGLRNADYPYAIQDKTKADLYAAAWTMDSIFLPSGGKIGMTYESDDYGYVQDKRAASMVSIMGFGNNPTGSGMSNKLYDAGTQYDYIFLQLPVPVASNSKKELRDRYFTDIRQVFMKLSVVMPPDDDGTHVNPEMIPIYAEFSDNDDFGFVSGHNDQAYIKVKRLESGNTPMVQFAFAYMKNFLPHKAYPGYDVSGSEGLEGTLTALAGMFESFGELTRGEDGKFMHDNKCKEVRLAESFVRLSNPTAIKRGGGLRVKKIVITDNWNKMTRQYSSTYGQEYTYTTKGLINNEMVDISSGVAAWEPVIGGEENPHREIIRNLNRNKLGPFDYGVSETPMGEMFFPSPSVGYSKVTVNSIHRDTVKNAPGISVTEFYTTKDFPFKSSFTALDGAGKIDYETPAILKILHIDLKHRTTLSQGFKIDMNDMNGKEKSQATYSSLNSNNYISKTTNYYSSISGPNNTQILNNQFPTLDKPDGVINPYGTIGQDIELMADFREHHSMTYTSTLSLNLDFFWIGWFPMPLLDPLTPHYKDEKTYRSAAVTKIVNHYGTLDSIVVESKGSVVSTKNLLYDAETGNVLLSRTNNEHNKPVYNFTYPAHWAYKGMGPAYKNIDITFDHLVFRKGILETNIDMSFFESGDELYVISEKDQGPYKNQCDIPSCDDPYLVKNPAKRIWAVNTAETGGNPHWVFMDRNGNPYTADQAMIRIIRSGHRNMLDQQVGSITSLTSPIITNAAGQHLDFTDATNIVKTTAATFKEKWRVDNSFYRKDSIATNTTRTKVFPQLFSEENSKFYTITIDRGVFNFDAGSYVTASNFVYKFGGDTRIRKAFIQSYPLDNFLNQHYDPSCIIDGSVSSAFYPPTLYIPSTYCSSTNSNTYLGWTGFYGSNSIYGNKSILKIMNTQWGDGGTEASWRPLFNATSSNNSLFTTSMSDLLAPPVGVYHAYEDQYRVGAMIRKMMQERNAGINNAAGFSLEIFRPGPPEITSVPNQEDIKSGLIYANSSCSPNVRSGLSFNFYPCTGGRIVSLVEAGDPSKGAWCETVDTIFSGSTCISKFSRLAINPYVEGVLGNWRLDSTYVFYGKRKESDPSGVIDLRNAGTIIGFKKFWNFQLPLMSRNYDADAKAVWVWNSTITQYNRKGYEIENTDPLGRFNSGLYGYNQQLPIAVTNNAMLRETMFDGFEDYYYETGNCAESCKGRRHATFANITSNITDSFHHTGRYSLRLNSGQSLGFFAPVINKDSIKYDGGLRIKIDSIGLYDTIVSSLGNGLTKRSYDIASSICPPSTLSNREGTEYPNYGDVGANKIVQWKGTLVTRNSDYYRFRAYADDGFRIKINGNYITSNTGYGPGSTNCVSGSGQVGITGWGESSWIYLTKGQLYDIEINSTNVVAPGYFKNFQWQRSCREYEDIPLECLYPDNYGPITVSYPTPQSAWCTKLDSVQVTGNSLTDSFSIIQGKKMVVSAWVKEGGNDCKCSTYVKNSIEVSFTGSVETFSLKPTGNIIEGWQRYEEAITVPINATIINVAFRNQSDSAAYIDDVRMHPFNGNMKSFVYHSSNLRLMAELDENNYASFYEYDDDGTLTRVKKETSAGVKTITETRSALLLQ